MLEDQLRLTARDVRGFSRRDCDASSQYVDALLVLDSLCSGYSGKGLAWARPCLCLMMLVNDPGGSCES